MNYQLRIILYLCRAKKVQNPYRFAVPLSKETALFVQIPMQRYNFFDDQQ